MLNLDTHILIHALDGNLKPAERMLLSGDSWSISAMVLWEVTMLSRSGRIDLDLDDPEILRTLRRIHAWPLSLDVCRAIEQLDFQSDPADEIIAATSIVHQVPLVTRDRKLRNSKVVPLATEWAH
jgi:PIN domain nuclease of toxin-antitoxin system